MEIFLVTHRSLVQAPVYPESIWDTMPVLDPTTSKTMYRPDSLFVDYKNFEQIHPKYALNMV